MPRFGPFDLDPVRRQLLHSGTEVHLTPKAFTLLELLLAEAPRVVPKEELHRRLWPRVVVSDATLAGLLKEVRRALRTHAPGQRFIRTAHRVGYAFCGTLEPLSGAPLRTASWLIAGKQRISLNAGENIVGRDPQSAVWLDHSTVSRRHARIVIGDDGATLEDLGSKNGTRIGAATVTGVETLRDGDRVWFGQIAATFRASRALPATATHVSVVAVARWRP